MVLVELSNRQPNLFVTEEVTQALTDGTATYALAERTIDIQVALIRTTLSSVTTDIQISAMSTTDYAGIATKGSQGRPSSFWFKRTITPTITLWPVPDSSDYTLVLRQLSRIEDAVLSNAVNVAVPYRWLDAYTAALASRLAVLYAPDKAQGLLTLAERAWGLAAKEDTENVALRIAPMINSYYS